MGIPSDKAKYPVRSHNQESNVIWVRLTTAAGAAVPVVTVNGGGLVESIAYTGVGDFLLTLKPRFNYLSCRGNCQAAGVYVSTICIEGNAAANSIQILTFLGVAAGTATTDPTSKVIDLHITAINRVESAA